MREKNECEKNERYQNVIVRSGEKSEEFFSARSGSLIFVVK